jgi:NAD(P)-dependent dehydrogenase (short-subunit alcohol dehydrogenase family)
MSGRGVIVTGAGSGMGAAMAEEFVRLGDVVAAWDLNEGAVKQLADRLPEGKCFPVTADVGDPSSVEAGLTESLKVLPHIDVLCSNAGVLDDYTPALDTPIELWNRIIATDLTAGYLMARAVLPNMLSRGGGVIVYTASISGFIAGGGGAAYTSAKHGLIGLTKQMAFDYGRQGIRCNAICPGPVRTGMTEHLFTEEGRQPHVDAAVAGTPAGRWADPVEIARLAAYLASDDASFIHGATYMIDGGWTIS